MTTLTLPPVSVVILAGGHGERIGQDKALLEIGNQSLLQRSIKTARELSADVICVARPDQNLAVNDAVLVHDPPGWSGVLPAILVGFQAARYPWIFLAACDMPFINLALVRYMLGRRDACAVVVPSLKIGYEPLHALYHRSVIPNLAAAIAEGRHRAISFYQGLEICEVKEDEIKRYDPQLISFFNVNTEADLAQAREWDRTNQAK
ncbi:MAG: molybdenum cofactor guanylyltransferase [Anaerolineae bacterium]